MLSDIPYFSKRYSSVDEAVQHVLETSRQMRLSNIRRPQTHIVLKAVEGMQGPVRYARIARAIEETHGSRPSEFQIAKAMKHLQLLRLVGGRKLAMPEEAKAELAKIFANPTAKPHHLAIYGLRRLGHLFKELAWLVGTHTYEVKQAYSEALKLATGEKLEKRPVDLSFLRPKPTYTRVVELLDAVGKISREIKELPKKEKTKTKTPPLSDFEEKVAAIARQRSEKGLRFGQRIIAKIIIDEGWQQEEQAAMVAKVARALYVLKRRQALPKNVRSMVPRIRESSEEEVAHHIDLVHRVLRDGHRFLYRWRDRFTYEDALAIGRDGLREALRVRDPQEERFAPYAKMRIASQITQEVKKKQREKSLEAPMRPGSDERTLGETLAAPTLEKPEVAEILEQAVNLHVKGKVTRRQLEALALKYAFDHKQKTIGSHYGVTSTTIYHDLKAVVKQLKKLQKP